MFFCHRRRRSCTLNEKELYDETLILLNQKSTLKYLNSLKGGHFARNVNIHSSVEQKLHAAKQSELRNRTFAKVCSVGEEALWHSNVRIYICVYVQFI